MASIKDVAHLTGCSPSTVSRVVNKKGNISEEMERRVLEAIQQVGYIPNSVARSLKNSKTNTIGVIVPDISESFFAQIIKGINLVSGEKDYSIMLCDSSEDPERESSLISLLSENRVEGMIIATVQNDDRIEDVVHQVGCPIVFVDNVPGSIRGFDSVSTDNIKASYLAVEHLVNQGHKRIAAIMGKRTEHTGFDRYSGYLKALAHRNIPVEENLVRFGDFKEQSGYEAMMDLLASGLDFTAVYIASSKMTYGAIAAIREAGLRM
ncbi:MAG: LacI family transcriptional regulator, partial [Ruminococcaceae bacterium]|nr:LacI family transcriptional regulator [Oscillospiraceae bacterium]